VITDVGMPPEVKVTPEEMSAIAAKLGD
jgi:hypothetical protein